MDQPETAHLTNEIIRLNRIIAALLDSNEALKKELSYVRIALGDIKKNNPHLTYNMGITKDVLSNENLYMDINNSISSDVKNVIGVVKDNLTNEQKYIGVNKDNDADENFVLGINKNISSNEKRDMGINNKIDDEMPPFRIINGKRTFLTDFVPLVERNIYEVYANLKMGIYSHSKNSGKKNIAKILIHIYNKGDASHKALQHITGLSKSGIAKMMMSLQRNDTIQRTGFKQFKLSESALNILRDTFEYFKPADEKND